MLNSKLRQKTYNRYKNVLLRLNERTHVQFARNSGQPAVSEKCLIGTFHKTGTVLANSLFGQFCLLSNTPIWHSHSYSNEPDDWMFVTSPHSDFQKIGVDPSRHNTVVFIRDPRDVILSAIKYHLVSSERWLHIARKEFGGKTYQEKLASLPTTPERISFEIDHSAGKTISLMIAARESPLHKATLFARLDKMMFDRTLNPYLGIFMHLGINPAYLPLGLSLAYRNSVFRKSFRSGHITSGKTQLWKTEFSDQAKQLFERRFPNAIQTLGYEDW